MTGPDGQWHVPGQLTIDDALPPRILSMFTGYAGLDMAAREVLGGHVVAHAEIDPAACAVLAHRFPGVPNVGDVAAVDWQPLAPVDVLTAGFPCQDVSSGGLRLGLRPGTRSGLWSQVVRAIDELRPGLVVIENVRGLLSARAAHPSHSDVESCPWCMGVDDPEPLRALGAVLGDLADLRYDAAWRLLPAADVGAPHRRSRVFLTAWPDAADPDSAPGAGGRVVRGGSRGGTDRVRAVESRRHGAAAADPDSDGRESLERAPARRDGVRADVGDDADGRGPVDWGQFTPATRRWEAVLGRAAPAPTATGPNGGTVLHPPFVEWMQGLPAGWVTAVPGLKPADMLRMLGNGVVPQQAAAALRSLLPHVAAPPSEQDEGAA